MNEPATKAQVLWAKKSRQREQEWLPLIVHMRDAAEVARHLWRNWLPEGVKVAIASGIQCEPHYHKEVISRDIGDQEEVAEQLFYFLASAHDLGKATPLFQTQYASYPPNMADRELLSALFEHDLLPDTFDRNYFNASIKIPHALASQTILEDHECHQNIASVLGSHHGKPVDYATYNKGKICQNARVYHSGPFGKEAWQSIHIELIRYILNISGYDSLQSLPIPDMSAQVLLSGLVIMADWIASNEHFFPYIELDEPWGYLLEEVNIKRRVGEAWRKLQLTDPWFADNSWMRNEFLTKRFSKPGNVFVPRPMQDVAHDVASRINAPGIMVIEAPMGQGKTEAALAAVEVFAHKSGRSGLFFALPTQATSDGIFPRIRDWAETLGDGKHSIRLAHGKAQFNEDYTRLPGGSTNICDDEKNGQLIVHQWFEGRKKSLLLCSPRMRG